MAVTAAVAAVAGTTYAIYSGERAADQQQDALRKQEVAQGKAEDKAKQQERQSEQAQNAANRKSPDAQSILSSAMQSANSAGSGTMLTGPMGVDPNALALGKNTLLGG